MDHKLRVSLLHNVTMLLAHQSSNCYPDVSPFGHDHDVDRSDVKADIRYEWRFGGVEPRKAKRGKAQREAERIRKSSNGLEGQIILPFATPASRCEVDVSICDGQIGGCESTAVPTAELTILRGDGGGGLRMTWVYRERHSGKS